MLQRTSLLKAVWVEVDRTTAGAIAHLSAHMPTGVEATSTLPPEKYTPDVSRMDAPTRKLLYGPMCW
jgi:hypothetical protein